MRSRRSAHARRGLDWLLNTKIRLPRFITNPRLPSRATRGSLPQRGSATPTASPRRAAAPCRSPRAASYRGIARRDLIGHDCADRSEHGQPGHTITTCAPLKTGCTCCATKATRNPAASPAANTDENQLGRFGATGLIADAGGSITRKRTTPVDRRLRKYGPSPYVPPMRRTAPSSRRNRD